MLVAHAEHVADVGTTGAPAEGLWRWDREGADTVPIDALPRNVRPILEGAIARGEAWLVKIDGPGINVQAGRGRAFGETDAPTVGLRLDVVAGKVRKVQTVDPRRPNAPTGWWDATVTDARRLFPGPGEAVMPAA